MPEPSDPAALDLKYHTLALCLLIEFFVRDLIGPEDATYSPEASVVEGVDLVHVALYHSPALGAI